MSSSRKLLSALALVLLVLDVDSSSSSSGSGNIKPSSTDLRGRDLVNLLNSRVYLAEKMSTPIDSSSNNVLRVLGFRHSGVRVTLRNGSKWLVHKGNKFGLSSQTVVTDARYMGRGWRVERTKNFHGSQTVSDLIRTGGRHYDLVFDNCHHAANRIMNLP